MHPLMLAALARQRRQELQAHATRAHIGRQARRARRDHPRRALWRAITLRRANILVGSAILYTSSVLSVENHASATALSRHDPDRLIDWVTRFPAHSAVKPPDVYWAGSRRSERPRAFGGSPHAGP